MLKVHILNDPNAITALINTKALCFDITRGKLILFGYRSAEINCFIQPKESKQDNNGKHDSY